MPKKAPQPMNTIAITIDGKDYVAIPAAEFKALAKKGLVANPKADQVAMGSQLALWRTAAGLSQEDLAQAAKVTRKTVYFTETGQRAGAYRKLADALEKVLPFATFKERKGV